MTDILRQKCAYRRGLILGLTMAESVILIIFALLLALAAFLIQKDQTIRWRKNSSIWSSAPSCGSS